MNTRKISKLANELIMDELLGTGQNDELKLSQSAGL